VPGVEDVFDRVEVSDDGGRVQNYTRAQFAALPITERVQVLLRRKPVFYKGAAVVPAREAVKSI
jgi:hypothetical protein